MTSPQSTRPPVRVEQERFSSGNMVCTVDHLASTAGVKLLDQGGNAVDAAIAASAALAVTTQQMCGMGGDLFALVHSPGDTQPLALNSAGKAGSGADAAAMRAEGLTQMPFRKDLRSSPLPGCVDGWVSLHERLGRLPLSQVFAPAISLARNGFPASLLLARSLSAIEGAPGSDDYFPNGDAVKPGQRVVREGIARSLEAIAAGGRSAWYEGEFGSALQRAIPGQFSGEDLATIQAEWVTPLVTEDVWGHDLWTAPPTSQGYLALSSARIASKLDLPKDPNDPQWAHLLVEASKQAAYDRLDVLHQNADGQALLTNERLQPRWEAIDSEHASLTPAPTAGGGTIYLCATDADGMGVSLIQSNAAGFGANVGLPEIGVFIQNRGLGFSLQEGHPAELTPGHVPPSTLLPAMITHRDGRLRTVLGTMGGDGQPQVVLQMMARLLHSEQRPGKLLTAPRFTMTVPNPVGFNTWGAPEDLEVGLEAGTPWNQGLASRGHKLAEMDWGLGTFGHAHMIDVRSDHVAGVADPRALIGAALGL